MYEAEYCEHHCVQLISKLEENFGADLKQGDWCLPWVGAYEVGGWSLLSVVVDKPRGLVPPFIWCWRILEIGVSAKLM